METKNLKNLINENIISVLGLEDLPEERKASLIEKFSELAEKRIVLRLMEELPEEGHREFEEIADKGDEEKAEFLQKKFANLDEIIEEEALKVKKELFDESEKIEEEIFS